MKFATSLVIAAAAVISNGAIAATKNAEALSAQQQKLSACSKDAHSKGLKGDDYKSFMSTCLKSANASPTTAAPTSTPLANPAAAPASTSTKSTPSAAPATPATAPVANSATSTTPAAPLTASERKAAAANDPQQQKLKACATQAKAKNLKGADRRNYMTVCLKGDSSATPSSN